jgi:hypothetical protein
MEKFTRDTGNVVKCKEKVKQYGQIKKNMLVIIIMIKKMEKVCLCGLMEKFIKDNGKMVTNMGQV